jgi:transposase
LLSANLCSVSSFPWIALSKAIVLRSALVRVPSEQEEQLRAIHRQREQLVKARKQLEAQGRSLMVNHGIEPVKNWWKRRCFATLAVPQ